jgi:dTDP-4-dehydrorhamnose reductase
MKRLLVFGAGGMTGWEIAQRASAHGFECTALTRGVADISDISAIMGVVAHARPDVVINAAAYTAVDKAEGDRDAAMRINAGGAGNVAKAAADHGAAIVHISTDYVFDGRAKTPYPPDHHPNPIGAYGESKLAGEDAVRSGARRHVIVRTSWVFSHRGRNFVRTMLDRGRAGQSVRVVNDQFGRPTSAADLADSLLTAAARLVDNESVRGTYHFANAGVTTWYDFARAIFELDGIPAAVEPITTADFPTAAKRPAWSVLDTTSMEQTFGVKPRAWRDALGETLELIN